MINLLLASCIIVNIYDVPKTKQIRVELINSQTEEKRDLLYKDHEELEVKYNEIESISLDMNKRCH
jgi:membrane-bound inhibitor of C-type lysozyme